MFSNSLPGNESQCLSADVLYLRLYTKIALLHIQSWGQINILQEGISFLQLVRQESWLKIWRIEHISLTCIFTCIKQDCNKMTFEGTEYKPGIGLTDLPNTYI